MSKNTIWIIILVLLTSVYTSKTDELSPEKENTDIANEPDDRLLILSTLDGTLFGIEQQTGHVRWKIKDKPVVKVPSNTSDAIIPLFLPDPRDGSIYLLGGSQEPLKKLPFTIPQLVASSPCRSSDGILYTGKKKDVWFILDPKTGQRQQILGWDSMGPTCPVQNPEAVYIGRTQYSIMMIDSQKGNRKWNVTFYEYSATPMSKEMLNKYDLIHFASSSSGRVVTIDRRGSLLWDIELSSPLISAYILDPEGLLVAPFTSLANHTLAHLAVDLLTQETPFQNQPSRMKLYPTLYIGEHVHGLYAIPSLVDQNMVTITASEGGPLLLEGSDVPACPRVYAELPIPGQNYHFPAGMKKADPSSFQSLPNTLKYTIFIGHYNVPEFSSIRLMISGRNYPQMKLITDESSEKDQLTHLENNNSHILETEEEGRSSVGVQTDDFDDATISPEEGNNAKEVYIFTICRSYYKDLQMWINQQDNKGLKLLLIILVGCVVAMFWYLKLQVREMQQLSQNGSKGSQPGSIGRHGAITAVAEELGDGLVRVGKITFHPEQLLGKGCEGTFVFRGEFDRRQVAVKRLLPECFTFADREVALLRESDAHPNVIRYFCTEQDRMFRYIALELCQATLHDYVQGKFEIPTITPLEILKQATSGLAHLHSLDIVHRDIKPQNVLLSGPNAKGEIRALISDFGLCKKLQVGRMSFSRRSGITGTDGWIAPEMLKGNERTTFAVDMFSLGCVFYYVLSEGKHPFGDPLRRQANIHSGECYINDLKGEPWQVEIQKPLLSALVSPQAQDRPPCSAILMHPMFWSKATILAFLQDVSDRVEKSGLEDPVLAALESGGPPVVKKDWRFLIDEEVARDLRKYRSYQGESVRDLLRALRNKKHHFRELTAEAQENLGEIPNQFTNYWTSRFPLLLVQAWLSMQCVASEPTFQQYYHPTHRYPLLNFTEEEYSIYLENVDIVNPNVDEHFNKKKKENSTRNARPFNRSPKKMQRPFFDNMLKERKNPQNEGSEDKTAEFDGAPTISVPDVENNVFTGSKVPSNIGDQQSTIGDLVTKKDKRPTRYRKIIKKTDPSNWRMPTTDKNYS